MIRRPAAFATVFLLVTSCSSVTLPDGNPQEGIIVARDGSSSISGDLPTVWVKSSPVEECGTIFTILPSTTIGVRSPSGRVSEAGIGDLTEGRRVRVWAEWEMRSCPAQSEASGVEILPD
jgi:hypothetical protein